MKSSTHLLLPEQSPKELATSLEVLLHGYLHYAFEIGISAEEAMGHFENVQPLIRAIHQQVQDGNQGNQTAA